MKSFLPKAIMGMIYGKAWYLKEQPCGVRYRNIIWFQASKYRKMMLRGEDREKSRREIFREIAEHHEFEIDTLEVAPDNVHICSSFPPRDSIARVVGMLEGNKCECNIQGIP